ENGSSAAMLAPDASSAFFLRTDSRLSLGRALDAAPGDRRTRPALGRRRLLLRERQAPRVIREAEPTGRARPPYELAPGRVGRAEARLDRGDRLARRDVQRAVHEHALRERQQRLYGRDRPDRAEGARGGDPDRVLFRREEPDQRRLRACVADLAERRGDP